MSPPLLHVRPLRPRAFYLPHRTGDSREMFSANPSPLTRASSVALLRSACLRTGRLPIRFFSRERWIRTSSGERANVSVRRVLKQDGSSNQPARTGMPDRRLHCPVRRVRVCVLSLVFAFFSYHVTLYLRENSATSVSGSAVAQTFVEFPSVLLGKAGKRAIVGFHLNLCRT